MTEILQRADPDLIFQTLLRDAGQWFNVQNTKYRKTVINSFLTMTLPRFASLVSELDERVGRDGFVAGINWILPHLQMTVTGHGLDNVPKEGPVLLTSNHPGGGDFLAVFSQVPRDDARLVAAVEQLDLLPNVVKQVVYTSNTRGKKGEKGATTRKLISELSQGHLVLIYPRGKMEADPRWAVGGREDLQNWSKSIERFAEAVPDLTIVPTAVGGVISPRAINLQWINVYRNERVRQRVANFAQVLMGVLRPDGWAVHPEVWFGEPILARDYDPEEVRLKVLGEVDHLLSYLRSPNWPVRHRTTGWIKR